MAKVTLIIQDSADGRGADMIVDGDFEDDISKCTPAQRMALSLIAMAKSHYEEASQGNHSESQEGCSTC